MLTWTDGRTDAHLLGNCPEQHTQAKVKERIQTRKSRRGFYQCSFLGGDICTLIMQDVAFKETGQRAHILFLYHFLQLFGNSQWSQMKKKPGNSLEPGPVLGISKGKTHSADLCKAFFDCVNHQCHLKILEVTPV